MKLRLNISKTRPKTGMLLIECLVYIAVFAILLGIGTATFYLFWDHSKALLYTTNDIESALYAGERWRADVRDATGKISVETASGGELLRIPHGKDEIFYSFHDGSVLRKMTSSNTPQLLFEKVKTSQMIKETRDSGLAWRWELELSPHRKEMHLPLVFTFEAVQTKS